MKLILSIFFTILLGINTNAQRWNGLTLIAGSANATMKLIDTNGTTIKTITGTGGNTGYSSYMSQGGYFWRSVKKTTIINGGGIHGGIQKLDWNGNILVDYTLNTSTMLFITTFVLWQMVIF
jgi:hypothetical protein